MKLNSLFQQISIRANRIFRAGAEADRTSPDPVADNQVDYPSEKELSDWENRGLIERRPEGKSQQLADFFKKHGVDDDQ